MKLLAALIPSPLYGWALLAVFALGAATAGSAAWKVQTWRYGSAIAEQKAEAEKTLRAATTAALKKERENGRVRDAVEKDLQSAQAKNRALSADLRKLAAQSGGLRDPGRGQGCNSPPRPADEAPGVNTDPAPGGTRLLSKQLEEYIFDTAEKADEVLAYAWACHDWAMKAGQ